MFKYINRLLAKYGHGLIIKSVYGLQVEPNPNREKQVQKIIASMGDKYLLAKPIRRKTNGL